MKKTIYVVERKLDTPGALLFLEAFGSEDAAVESAAERIRMETGTDESNGPIGSSLNRDETVIDLRYECGPGPMFRVREAELEFEPEWLE